MLELAGIFLLSFAPALLAQSSAVAKRTTAVRANDAGMQQAIRFERFKDRQDATQARKERLHPMTYDYSADRSAEGVSTVKDPGAVQYRRHRVSH